jgi:paraquat-inducible protein B
MLLDHADTTVTALNGLVASPEVRQSLGSLDASLSNLSHLTHKADLQAGPLLTGLRSVSRSAAETLHQASTTLSVTNTAIGDGNSSGHLAATLDELKQAARSLRDLADYLEAHPGSLLRGKSGSAAQ